MSMIDYDFLRNIKALDKMKAREEVDGRWRLAAPLIEVVGLIIDLKGYRYGHAAQDVLDEIEALRIYLDDLMEYEKERQEEISLEAE